MRSTDVASVRLPSPPLHAPAPIDAPGSPPEDVFQTRTAPFSSFPTLNRRAPPSLPPHQVLPETLRPVRAAHRIANLAFVSKAAAERENANLREQNADVKMKKQLERKAESGERAREAADKAVLAMEERDKLHAEKTALINTVKKLNREVAKLDNFKRNLMQTLQDEDDPVGAGTRRDRLVSGVLPPPRGCQISGGRHGCHSTRAQPPARSARIGGGSAASTPARSLHDGAGAGPSPAPADSAAGVRVWGPRRRPPLGWRIRWTERSSSDARGRG